MNNYVKIVITFWPVLLEKILIHQFILVIMILSYLFQKRSPLMIILDIKVIL